MLPEVDVLELKDVQFYVVTEENYAKVFEELRKKNYTPVIFGMSDDGYAEQAVNMAKILQLVQQHNELLRKEADANKLGTKETEGVDINGFIFKRLLPW